MGGGPKNTRHRLLRILLQWGCLGDSVGFVPNFSSGHDLTVGELEPCINSVLTGQILEFALDSVSCSLSAPPQLVLALSLLVSKINKH